MTYAVAFYEPRRTRDGSIRPTAEPVTRVLSLAKLVELLTVPRQVEHRDRIWCWAPHELQPVAVKSRGGREMPWRCLEAVVSVSCAVLDIDDGTPIAEGRAPWMSTFHVWHTSRSHTEGEPRYRIVMPLARPVPAATWPRAWAWLEHRSSATMDPKCKDASRAYYAPAVVPGGTCDSGVHQGDVLDLLAEDLPDIAQEQQLRQVRGRRRDIVRRYRGRPVPSAQARRAVADLLRFDPAARLRAADMLGAEVRQRAAGRIAFKVPCPDCGEASVWFPIDNNRMTGARCNHRKTCGWAGGLIDLLDELQQDSMREAS